MHSMARVSRRGFLRGRISDRYVPRPLRWRQSAASACPGCNACISACPETILYIDADGLPAVDFARGGCTLCGECIGACPSGVLTGDPARPFLHHATAGPDCLLRKGVVCRLCELTCETGAIRYRPMTGGRAMTEISESACTGCGSCLAGCPAQAIVLTPLRLEEART